MKNSSLVLLDSSFIISMLRERRDMREEVRSKIPGPIELVVLDLVKYELQRLARIGTGMFGRMAKLALETAVSSVRNVEAPFGPRDVDLAIAIFSLVSRNRVIVATSDKGLLEMCSKNRVPWIRPERRSGLIASWKDP